MLTKKILTTGCKHFAWTNWWKLRLGLKYLEMCVCQGHPSVENLNNAPTWGFRRGIWSHLSQQNSSAGSWWCNSNVTFLSNSSRGCLYPVLWLVVSIHSLVCNWSGQIHTAPVSQSSISCCCLAETKTPGKINCPPWQNCFASPLNRQGRWTWSSPSSPSFLHPDLWPQLIPTHWQSCKTWDPRW